MGTALGLCGFSFKAANFVLFCFLLLKPTFVCNETTNSELKMDFSYQESVARCMAIFCCDDEQSDNAA